MLPAIVGLVVTLVLLLAALAACGTWLVLTLREHRSLITGQRRDFDGLVPTLQRRDGLVDGLANSMASTERQLHEHAQQARNHAIVVDDRLSFYEKTDLKFKALRRQYDLKLEQLKKEHAAKVEAAKQPPEAAPRPDENPVMRDLKLVDDAVDTTAAEA